MMDCVNRDGAMFFKTTVSMLYINYTICPFIYFVLWINGVTFLNAWCVIGGHKKTIDYWTVEEKVPDI